MDDVKTRPAQDTEAPLRRSEKHEALAVFLGEWEASGTSYGETDRASDDPKANEVPWISTHRGLWHTGEFFLIQDERAHVGENVFDTLSVMGIAAQSGEYFAQTFENHGFERRYRVTHEGDRWMISGLQERATIEFRDSGRTQVISWEWKPGETWLPLCDRIAHRLV